jgi:hypothetical protein
LAVKSALFSSFGGLIVKVLGTVVMNRKTYSLTATADSALVNVVLDGDGDGDDLFYRTRCPSPSPSPIFSSRIAL